MTYRECSIEAHRRMGWSQEQMYEANRFADAIVPSSQVDTEVDGDPETLILTMMTLDMVFRANPQLVEAMRNSFAAKHKEN